MIAECLVVEFAVEGDACPLADAATTAGARVDCMPPQLRRDGNALLRFSANATVAEDLAGALDGDDRLRYLHRADTPDRATFRCLSKEPCVVHELTDAGLLVEHIEYTPDGERHSGAVVGYDVLRGVLSAAGDAVGVTVERIHRLQGDDEPVGGRWDLTPAQEAALGAAHAAGYFDVPRGATAAEVAAELDVSKSAFLERLRRGIASLLEAGPGRRMGSE